jgi:hypothetical protein
MDTIPAINYEVPKEVNHIYYGLGYKFKYIPYILAADIANVASNWKFSGRPSGFTRGTTGFNGKYREFLYSIPFDLLKETTPYYMAVEMIKKLSSKYNLRKIERAILNRDDDFNFEETEDALNPTIDVDILSKEVIETTNIDINKYIPLNIIKLLKETEKFTNSFKKTQDNKLKMTSYSQFKEIPKYKLLLPTFNYKYPLKNYKIPQKSPKEIVIFRDVSASAKVMEDTFKSLLLYFIQTYNNNKIITVYEFTDDVKKIITLNSIKDIQEYYNTEIKYYYSYLKFPIKYIKNYSECYIITCGVTDIYPRMVDCIVNGISKGGNIMLKSLCNNTKGKYMTI